MYPIFVTKTFISYSLFYLRWIFNGLKHIQQAWYMSFSDGPNFTHDFLVKQLLDADVSQKKCVMPRSQDQGSRDF